MMRAVLLILLTTLGLALPASALADAPASGVVVEGHSVPGVALGDTRAQVVAAWGPSDRCYDREVTGDQSDCRFPIDGGGVASVEFRGADGRYARNAPDDVVFEVSWGDAGTLSGWVGDTIDWTTTAGVNTELALTDQDAVAAAYPDAALSYDSLGIAVLDDARLGIRITWSYDGYTHTRGVRILIHHPQPAVRGDVMSVTVLELSATKTRSVRHILAVVRVQDNLGLPVDGARLSVTWTDPLGRTWTINSHNLTSETGYEFFEVGDARQGTWTFSVNDVTRDGYTFDPGGSLRTASIRVK
jgi:hypothetical protein